MILLCFFVGLSLQQELNIAISDLNNPLQINGWTVENNGVVNQYTATIVKCNQNLLLLNPKPNIYRKTFTIRDYEYDTLYLEMETYFMIFSESKIKIYINSNLIFKQKFTTNYMRLNDYCGNQDAFYTIYQSFNSQQTSLNFEIQFIATSATSQLGIRNLNIYTNGYKLSNGCNLDQPFLQGTQCVQYCSNSNEYLGGENMLVCQSGVTGQSGLIGSYLTNQGFLWKFTNPSPSPQEYFYLTASLYLQNSYFYTNIMHSELFKYIFTSATQYYYLTQSIQTNFKLQISFLFYILGDWDDGSEVGLYIIGDTIYQNNMVKIFKQMGKYYSSTGSGIYYTKIASPAGPMITVRRTLITYQANFYSSTVKIGFSQQLKGNTAQYGFGNIYIYELQNDPNIVLSGLYGLPYKCVANFYAYNGYCVQTCPPYSYQDQVNNNCTDFSLQYTKIFINILSFNKQGIYIVKEFYNNNFDWDTVKNLFSVILHPTNNYLNGQPFSFIGSKKILGGFSSWGWCSYGIQLSNLPRHNQIRLHFKLYLIDNWQSGDTFSYYLDGNLCQTYIQNGPNIQLQGLSNLDEQISVSYIYLHSLSTLSLFFICNIGQKNAMVASCGISDLYVTADQNIDIICPSQQQYFSYFTNNCENCVIPGCHLYPDHVPVPFNKCTIGCIDCFSNTICSQCDIYTSYQNDGNTCECQPGYVQQTPCNKCHYSCQECVGTTQADCSYCDITRDYVGGFCHCKSDKINVFSQSQCEPVISSSGYCHYSCATCFSTEYYHCITCPTGSNRTYKEGNTCPCNVQYEDTGLTNCVLITCDSTCLTCSGPLESNCLSCSTNFRFESGYCICDGSFNNINQSSNCVQNSGLCDQSCYTCFNSTPQGCVSCNTQLNRYLNINDATNEQQCICQSGYFEESLSCQDCDNTCQTCSSSAISCTSCDSQQNREIGNINQCICKVGYNDKLNPGQSCVQDLTDCHYSCTKCFGSLSTQCLACNSTYRLLNNTTCDCLPSQYDNGQLQCQNCYHTCSTCNGSSINNCLTCDSSQFRILFSNYCNCITGYNDKLNTDSCQQDSHTCHQTCLTCYGLGQNQCISCPSNRTLQGDSCICKSIYFESQSICQLCDYTCLTCGNSGPNSCIDCDGQNFRQKINIQCACMSGYVDVGNPQCQVCPNDCRDCDSQLKCLSCNIEQSFINSIGRCDCVDGYLLHNFECLNCHDSCQKCSGLLNSQCTQCDPLQFRQLTVNFCQCFDGYQENDIGQCVDCQSDSGKGIFSCQYKNAFDGVWTYGEQCDDGNNYSRDGCNNFQITNNYSCLNVFNQPSKCYKCPDNCLKCDKQQDKDQTICIACDKNFYNAFSDCIPCNEKSCLECIQPSYCAVCKDSQTPFKGRCNTCAHGYYYEYNQCISKCGDGIKTNDEQCDDGNTLSSDGCSELCQVEQDFVCTIINNNSNCFMHEQPYLIYEELKQQNNELKRIIISVSQNVRYGDISIELVDQPNIQKQYVVQGNDRLMIDLQLTFNQSYDSISINLIVKGFILNQYEQALINNKLQVTLQNIIVLSEQQKQTAQQLSSVGQGVVIGLFSISTTTIFMAGISQFVSFLNLVQQLLYIQYINIQFPPHFMQFLDIFNGFTITPIFEQFSIQQKLTQLDPQQLIFLQNGMNAYYLANIQGFLISSILLIIIYIQLKLSINAIKYIKQYLLIRKIININFYNKLNRFQLQFQKTSSLIRKQGLNQLICSTCYDMQFAIFLQLNNQKYDNFDLMINCTFAFLNLLFYMKFMGNKIKNDQIIDGRWQSLYQQVKLLAALIFTFAIVILQDFPQSQLLIISSTSILTSFYLFMVQPFKNILRNYQLIIQEMSLCIASITFMAYIYFPKSVDPIVLGWFHITTFLSMLFGNLVIDLYQFVMNIKRLYCK